MRNLDLIRAWKDAEFHCSLGEEARARLPENPAGTIELADAVLDNVVGARTEHLATIGCCSGLTSDPGLCTALFCTFTCYPAGTLEYTCAFGGC